MRAFSSLTCCPVLALVVAALGACGDQSSPTAAAPELRPHALIDESGGDPPPEEEGPSIAALSTTPSTLRIGGPSATFTATLQNPGVLRAGLSLVGVIRQGTAWREAGSAVVACGAGAGVLPAGANCAISGAFVASNTKSGTRTLVAGPAIFELQLLDEFGGLVATRSRSVTLVGPAMITALTMSSTSLVLDGASVPYTAIIENPGSALPGVLVQGWIRQGTVRSAAGGTVVSCGSGTGVLPAGTCTVSFVATASSYYSVPRLVRGGATFELELIDYARDPHLVLHTWTVPVTLLNPAKITAVTMSSTTLFIDGPPVPYTLVIENSGSTLPSMWIRIRLRQELKYVEVGAVWVSCGSGEGVLPPGTCTVSGSAFARAYSADPLGPQWLEGAASLSFQLMDDTRSATQEPYVVMDGRSVTVTLLAATDTVGQR